MDLLWSSLIVAFTSVMKLSFLLQSDRRLGSSFRRSFHLYLWLSHILSGCDRLMIFPSQKNNDIWGRSPISQTLQHSCPSFQLARHRQIEVICCVCARLLNQPRTSILIFQHYSDDRSIITPSRDSPFKIEWKNWNSFNHSQFLLSFSQFYINPNLPVTPCI